MRPPLSIALGSRAVRLTNGTRLGRYLRITADRRSMIHRYSGLFAAIFLLLSCTDAWGAENGPPGKAPADGSDVIQMPAYQFPPETVSVANAAYWKWMRAFYDR